MNALLHIHGHIITVERPRGLLFAQPEADGQDAVKFRQRKRIIDAEVTMHVCLIDCRAEN